ncbi:MAG: hypothetical protein J6C64_07730 [Lachnospiraceae bacterium]|nr:hypothetical protein [Lachnospiraceae bacterium]
MASKLKKYFPMIRERKDILDEIRSRKELEEQFESWSKERQEDFLNFCTGVRGIKLLYDGFFKEIMNPEHSPERLNDFLSQALRKKVKVLTVLPADSGRIADESSLVIMDIVVELEDGSIANVEVQKIARKVFMSFPILIIIILNKNLIQDYIWNFCRNTCSYPLTYSRKFSTIKK